MLHESALFALFASWQANRTLNFIVVRREIMGTITFVVPYPEIIPLVQKISHEQHDDEWQISIVEALGVRGVKDIRFYSDVVIARGVVSAALKARLANIPVVDLMVSGYDVMRALIECRNRFRCSKIAIVGACDMIYGAPSMQELLNVELTTVTVNNEEEAEEQIGRLKSEGIRVVIGGVMSTEIAAQFGLETVVVDSGPEAIRQAIIEAKRVGKVRRTEQERSEQFRTILNYVNEGVIVVDSSGTIQVANTVARRLVNFSENLIKFGMQDICPDLNLDSVLTTGNAKLGEVKIINGQQVAINSVPIIIKNGVAGAVTTFQPVSAIQQMEEQIRQKIHQRGLIAKVHFNDILGQSPAIKESIAMAREFSKVDSNVLIIGPTGTGKEMFAQSIHNSSRRSRGPFVAVNCAALPEELLESELFGYVEGAFTGALRTGKAGFFEQAHRGTLFMDEIADVSPKLQARLLRVLQEREIRRLGDSKVIPIDVRVITATNKDLQKMMLEGTFRADLYYRLDVLRVTVPSLAERSEDIVPLMRNFMRFYCAKVNKPCRDLSSEVEAMFIAYPWPGNIRELRNVAERLAVVTNREVINKSILLLACPQFALSQNQPNRCEEKKTENFLAEDSYRTEILEVLAKTHYHYGRAAAELGIGRTTLWRRMKEFGISRSK